MSSTGRRKNPVWQHFVEIRSSNGKTIRAKCKLCKEDMVGLVARMKQHRESKCSHRNNAIPFEHNTDLMEYEEQSESSVMSTDHHLKSNTSHTSSFLICHESSQSLQSHSNSRGKEVLYW